MAEKRKKFEEEQRREEIKLQMQRHYTEERRDSDAPKEEGAVRAKLPELIITKFNGTHLDWFQF